MKLYMLLYKYYDKNIMYVYLDNTELTERQRAKSPQELEPVPVELLSE